jgi:hypothetical protein
MAMLMLVYPARVVIKRPGRDCTNHLFYCMEVRKNGNQVGLAEMVNSALTHPADNHRSTIHDGRNHGLMASLV